MSPKDAIRAEVKTAIALFYDGNGAPQITAKGEGTDAEEIIKIAQENKVPLCDNAALAALLSHIELGDRVPNQLYQAVAYVIAFAYKLKIPEPMPGAVNPSPNPTIKPSTNPLKI